MSPSLQKLALFCEVIFPGLKFGVFYFLQQQNEVKGRTEKVPTEEFWINWYVSFGLIKTVSRNASLSWTFPKYAVLQMRAIFHII